MGGDKREIYIRPIGIIRSPFPSRKEAPKQGFLSSEASRVELFQEYEKGVEGIRIGDILDILYWMGRAKRTTLWNRNRKKGVFGTRGPDRPNPVGICPVEVVGIEKNILHVVHLDAVDGSPVLDIRHSLFDSLDGLKTKKF
ncbi:MAG: tRNA (N6-threonylcarbamoyladenosine(37)-N6)-methyltransferase TrmO [Deltaproteobacteria bacterium]|nr:tRNA (N6-threonylcarbamoyladenosine(37)-N6)-methyltransferase TrmO [Deltaproteobacteria bacterium]NIS77584.1 tRNA (N6-threonylcarbamoyladenosine(37)-N6)-methyltransferase TrmO [Deltaproteobacteria bacterium]